MHLSTRASVALKTKCAEDFQRRAASAPDRQQAGTAGQPEAFMPVMHRSHLTASHAGRQKANNGTAVWTGSALVVCAARPDFKPLVAGQQQLLAACRHAPAPLCHHACVAVQDEAAKAFITGQEQLSERQEFGTTASVNSKKVSLHLR